MQSFVPTIKPQDVLVLAKLIILQNQEKSPQKELAKSLGLSQAEVSNALTRLKMAGLLSDSKTHIKKLAAIEFIKHALKFMFPIRYSGMDRGILAGPSTAFVKEKVITSDGPDIIWQDSSGKNRGLCVGPIYPTVTFAVKKDPELYRLLTIIELFRGLGSTRHLHVASIWLDEMVKGKE